MNLRTIDDDGEVLTLRERATPTGPAWDLVRGNVVLLSSAALETERAFGELAGEGARHVLIGGLGFGATLRGALSVAASDARVVVIERLRAVERLLRGELAHVAEGALADPRAAVEQGDVADAIASARDLDAILLDVDNGPEWASFRTNARLYAHAGLVAAHAALRPGGTFAVWSGYRADAFLPRLRAAGFHASVVELRERGIVRARAYVGTRRAV